jgi:hypothetical protein
LSNRGNLGFSIWIVFHGGGELLFTLFSVPHVSHACPPDKRLNLIMLQRWSNGDRDIPHYPKKYFSQHHLAHHTRKYLWSDPELNPRLRVERPTTNILSHGMTMYKETLNKLCIIHNLMVF